MKRQRHCQHCYVESECGTCMHAAASAEDYAKRERAKKSAAPQPSADPVAWEWRWFDASPYTVTSGQWSEWKRVEPRNALCTIEDALAEFRAYIASGQRYELRALYTYPQPDDTCRDWSLLEATQASLREHIDMIQKDTALLRNALKALDNSMPLPHDYDGWERYIAARDALRARLGESK